MNNRRNRRKYQGATRNGKLLVNIENGHHQKSGDERKITKDYFRQVWKFLENKLCYRHLTKAINTWAVPLVKYSGQFFKRTREKLRQIDQKRRKLMTVHKALYLRDDIDGRHEQIRKGTRGLTNIEDSMDASLEGLEDCIKKKKVKLNTETSISTRNIKINRTISNIQKLEEKELNEYFKRLTLPRRLGL